MTRGCLLVGDDYIPMSYRTMVMKLLLFFITDDAFQLLRSALQFSMAR